MPQFPNIKTRPVSWLKGNVDRANICEDFEEATLNAIGADVLKWYGVDDESRSEWREKVEKGMEIAKQTMGVKNTPWPNCANTKDPLIAEAAMNFASRAMAEVVRGKDVVKTEVVGEDLQGEKEARAKRIGQCMSYQVLKQQPEWRPDTDQLLTSLPIIGMYYKKTYRDTMNGRNVSCALSPLTDVVVHNDTKTLALAERISWRFKRNRNYVLEKIRAGVWADIEEKLTPDEDTPLQEFIEQQCYYDLDDDGYKEPYLITVHKESGAVARICVCYDKEGLIYGDAQDDEGGEKVLRIQPIEYYTEFAFLLQPDGTFHKMGFAQLLGAINEEINTIQNQLIDSGTIANRRPGFIGKGAKLPAGGVKAQLGMLTPVDVAGQDLRASIVFPDFAGPSDVLFKMLELMLDRGHKLANISEGMQGETGGANVPATTTLALLDQALKVYTSILWRQYFSFDAEYKKLYRLNALYLTDEEYRNIVDDPNASVAADFDLKNCDIEPVMDPKASSEALRLARLNAMVQAAGMPPNVGRIYLQGIGCSEKDIETIFPKDQQPPPDPKLIEVQAKITQMQHQGAQKDRELELKHMEMEQKEAVAVYTIEKLQAEIVQIKANSIKLLADAEAAEVGTQIQAYQAELAQLNTETDQELQRQQMALKGAEDGAGTGDDGDDGDKRGELPSAETMDEQQNNQTGVTASEAAAGGTGAGVSAGAGEIGPDIGGGDMGLPLRGDSGIGSTPSVGKLAPSSPMQ